MPRLARRIGASGFYHITIRGNGHQILFESDADRQFFLKLLERYGQQYGIEYLAWCLMDNHIHLLMLDPSFNQSKALHDIGGVYAAYFNRSYDHVGSVFQSRFTNIPIETDNQLLQTMRYIHQNPLKPGLSQSLDYRWSSYDEYIHGGTITSTNRILEMLGGIEEFREYCSQYDEETRLMIDRATSGRLTDSEAVERAKQILGEELFLKLSRLAKRDRDDCLKALSQYGLNISQIARITGIGRFIVQRACGGKQASNTG